MPAAAPPKSSRSPARERLIDAAALVFARDGLAASTTREIARAAGVNEVTLFRLFRTKQNLLTAVLERVFAPSVTEGMHAPAIESDLSAIVREYAFHYAAGVNKNLALRRVLIGEIQHFQEHELRVIKAIFQPVREHLVRRLRAAQEAGLARPEINPFIVADQINAMVFMGVLKSAIPLCHEYPAAEYLEACVDTIVRAIEAPSRRPVS